MPRTGSSSVSQAGCRRGSRRPRRWKRPHTLHYRERGMRQTHASTRSHRPPYSCSVEGCRIDDHREVGRPCRSRARRSAQTEGGIGHVGDVMSIDPFDPPRVGPVARSPETTSSTWILRLSQAPHHRMAKETVAAVTNTRFIRCRLPGHFRPPPACSFYVPGRSPRPPAGPEGQPAIRSDPHQAVPSLPPETSKTLIAMPRPTPHCAPDLETVIALRFGSENLKPAAIPYREAGVS